MKSYRVLIGCNVRKNRVDCRFEIGEIITANQLSTKQIASLLEMKAIEEVTE